MSLFYVSTPVLSPKFAGITCLPDNWIRRNTSLRKRKGRDYSGAESRITRGGPVLSAVAVYIGQLILKLEEAARSRLTPQTTISRDIYTKVSLHCKRAAWRGADTLILGCGRTIVYMNLGMVDCSQADFAKEAVIHALCSNGIHRDYPMLLVCRRVMRKRGRVLLKCP